MAKRQSESFGILLEISLNEAIARQWAQRQARRGLPISQIAQIVGHEYA